MKSIIVILLSLITLSAYSSITDTIQAKSKITDVTVFFSGAQVSRDVELKLNTGKYLLLIDELPIEINPQSIQLEGIDDCTILSVKHQFKFQTSSVKSAKELEIEDKIDAKKLEIQKNKNQSAVFDLEEKLLLDNSRLSNNNGGSSIAEIKEAADYYRARLNEIRSGKLNLSTAYTKLTEDLQDLYARLNKLNANKKTSYSQILVALDCETALNSKLILRYYIPSAAWEPLYDFRVDDISEPLVIVYNANVFQSSGEDWNNVNITLSTSNPSLSGSKPQLYPWYLSQWRQQYQRPEKTAGTGGALKGLVKDKETLETLPFVNIILEASGRQEGGSSSDINGQYVIKPIPPGRYDIRATAIGYQELLVTGVQINANQTRFYDIELVQSSIELDNVVIMEYKVPLIDKDKTVSGGTVTQEEIIRMPPRTLNTRAASIGGVDPQYGTTNYTNNNWVEPEIETSDYISNTMSTRVTNLEYSIDIPYSIPSDGEEYGIRIKEVSLPVDYVNYAIPKLELDAFLTAEIKDWTQLDLISGKTSIYYQGTFTGESYIRSDLTIDTLSVSLGRDDQIILTREGNKDLKEKHILGSNIKETLGWDITLRNNKAAKIKIIIEDQYPISQNRSIEVELLESSNARVDEKTGKLSWEIELEPNEKKVLTYTYSVKYPKGFNLLLE